MIRFDCGSSIVGGLVMILVGAMLCSCSSSSDPADASISPDSVRESASAATEQPSSGVSSAPSQAEGWTMNPALGLTVTISEEAGSEPPRTFDDGRKQVIYNVDTNAPYSVFVEYYANGEKSADDILAVEQEAFSSKGEDVSAVSVSVDGGRNARRLEWSQQGKTRWSTESPNAEVELRGAAIIVDGEGGYSYSVYVMAPAANSEAVDAAYAVLDSLVVSAP
ncbi:hypothetical protein NSA19_08075 [Actinomyces bowdenii]|nr:hypothetical protein [Actinomyces bowdenii]